ncbi:epidermal growth factor receptor substrate 15-like [Linepithema humile]|uniref:epidermal growth factor receptor substrate 15-like n=1 Tax=Linepithema humile TaxID=83485 RepID=UPI00062309D6|nr:PREDICTED: myosin heavy chain, cardiac muscle isoform-like [Linepithema humile]
MSSEMSTINTESMDFDSELHQMERAIDHYKLKLQRSRENYERVETEICDVNQLQHKASFMLNDMQLKKENLYECLKNIHLNYESCVEKSGGYKDQDEKIRTKVSELATKRSNLMEELTQLKKNADDNDKKLVRVKAMITEQEQKNMMLLRELKKKSENVTFIQQSIEKRIDTVLQQLKISDNDDVTDNTLQ